MRFKNALFVIEKKSKIPHDYIDDFKQEIKEVIRVRSFLPYHQQEEVLREYDLRMDRQPKLPGSMATQLYPGDEFPSLLDQNVL